ncbi:hypothetical protein [Sinomonas atrocyanea]|uniref:hypothetical protein n=1 Tax=Sinomonas atrocyanea TaxID=37927 RepID=UPI003D979E38
MTMHRILASLFGSVRSQADAPHSVSRAAAERPTLEGPAFGGGVLVCSPWEGLYVDETSAF